MSRISSSFGDICSSSLFLLGVNWFLWSGLRCRMLTTVMDTGRHLMYTKKLSILKSCPYYGHMAMRFSSVKTDLSMAMIEFSRIWVVASEICIHNVYIVEFQLEKQRVWMWMLMASTAHRQGQPLLKVSSLQPLRHWFSY